MKKLLVLVLAGSVLLQGCAGFQTRLIPRPGATVTKTAPQLDTVARVSIHGRQFVIAGTAALDGVDGLMEAGLLPVEQGLVVLRIMKRVASECTNLADVLEAIDAAKTVGEKNAQVAIAKRILAGIRAGIETDAVIGITDPKVKAAVQSTLATFAGLTDGLSAILNMVLADNSFPEEQQWTQQHWLRLSALPSAL